jgi:hypothetical protein
VKIADLFAEADVVATLRVLSGDEESYEAAVYKARVLTAFKGTETGAVLFFGPYISYGIGSEYLAFLSRSPTVPQKTGEQSPYPALHTFHEVMYAGFSILELDFACVFGSESADERCDHAVRLNPEQVVLPERFKLFPEAPADASTNYHKWVRRKDLLAHLARLSRSAASPGR